MNSTALLFVSMYFLSRSICFHSPCRRFVYVYVVQLVLYRFVVLYIGAILMMVVYYKERKDGSSSPLSMHIYFSLYNIRIGLCLHAVSVSIIYIQPNIHVVRVLLLGFNEISCQASIDFTKCIFTDRCLLYVSFISNFIASFLMHERRTVLETTFSFLFFVNNK